jgi:hypothetical protein
MAGEIFISPKFESNSSSFSILFLPHFDCLANENNSPLLTTEKNT